jgi:hypothetical protein
MKKRKKGKDEAKVLEEERERNSLNLPTGLDKPPEARKDVAQYERV